MLKLIRFIILILLIGSQLVSCSYLKNVRLLMDPEIRSGNYVEVVPFEMKKDLIVVEARLNSDNTARAFIFDTGAFNSKVESDLASGLDLKVITEKTNSTAQGVTRTIEVVRVDSFRIGATNIYDLGAGKLEYAPNSASFCIAEHGIIGANLIKLAHWKIDYRNQLLYFSDQPFEVNPQAIVLPFDRPLLSGTPLINLQIGEKTVENIMFDTGFNGGLVLPMALEKHFQTEQQRIILDESTSGIYGTNTDSVIVKHLEVKIGQFSKKIPVEFSALNKALLGNEFLKHFEVVLNYDEKEIYLHQQLEVTIEEPLHFIVAIKSDSIWTVNRTSPDLPVNLGDDLLTINGKKPHEFFTSHCEYVMNIGELVSGKTLTIQKMDGTYHAINIQ